MKNVYISKLDEDLIGLKMAITTYNKFFNQKDQYL